MATAKKLPSGSWRVKVYVGTDDSGKKIYKSITCDDKSAAGKKKCERMAAEYGLGHRNLTKSADTFDDAINVYLNAKEAVLSPSTMRGYHNIAKAIRTEHPKFVSKKLELIDQQDIQSVISIDSRSLSPKTVRNRHGFISAVLSYSNVDIKLNTTLPQKDAPDLYIPSDEEIKKLIDAVKGTELYIPVILGAFCTLRRGEICGLSIDDVDGNIIHVRHSLVQGSDKEYHLKNPKTLSSDRFIDAPEFVTDAIREQGYITKLNPHSITVMFGRVLKANDIPHFRFHDLRHYSISVQHALGIPDQYIMARSGHRTDSILKSVYRHAMSDRQKEMSAIANEHFNSLM